MKKLLLLLASLTLSGGCALAQNACPPSTLKVYQDKQEVNTKGSALPANITLVVTGDPACAGTKAYPFKGAELTLVRAKRPLLPARTVNQPDVDLTDFVKVYRPDDRLFIEVKKSDVATAAPGAPDESVTLNWILTK